MIAQDLLLDTRYALRVLRRSPGFTAVALLTLTLGIGANVVVFAVLNAVLLRPLNVNDPQSLYQIRHKPWTSGRLLTTSYPAFEDFRRRNTTFSGMTAVNGYSHAELKWRNAAVSVHGNEVAGNYFDLLGVQPEAGRIFHGSEEHGPGSMPYLVLSDALWRGAFQAERSIIGSTVEFNGHPFTVVGVAAAKFHGVERFVWPDYWLPMMDEGQAEDGRDYLRNRTATAVTVIGRLKPGVTAQQATEDLNRISAQLAREYPRTDDGLPLRLIHPGLWGDDREVVQGFLFGVTMLALLVLGAACANLASLFAARAADRSRELAVRVALGSSRQRLVRQLLTEAVLLSLMGGAAGLAGASVLLGILSRWPRAQEVHLAANIDSVVYLAGMAFTFVSALLFGMVPARHAWQSSPLQAMKGGQFHSPALRRFALRDVLLGLQIAICTLLITASLVAARGMLRMLHAPLGFEPRGAMLAEVELKGANDVLLGKRKGVIEAVRSIPGVTAVGAVSRTPMTGGMHGVPVYRPGTTEFTLKNYALLPYVFAMSPGFLEAAATRLLNGRDISWTDTAKTPHVAVVNETFARRMWGDRSAIGQWFVLRGQATQVVGLVETGKYHDMTELPQPVVYVSLAQSEESDATFVVRSRRSINEMTAELKRTLNGIEPNTQVGLQSWTDSTAGELFPARAATISLGVMGLLAAMLAVTGISGMAAYGVSRRMKELGIRAALGARKMQVMSAAVGRPIVLLGVGSALGLLAGVFASGLLRQIVYQANPRDPAVIVGAVLTMILLGIFASAVPARRALRADPSRLMREE